MGTGKSLHYTKAKTGIRQGNDKNFEMKTWLQSNKIYMDIHSKPVSISSNKPPVAYLNSKFWGCSAYSKIRKIIYMKLQNFATDSSLITINDYNYGM